MTDWLRLINRNGLRQKGGRPCRMEETALIARLYMVRPNQQCCSREAERAFRTTVNSMRWSKRLARGALGPFALGNGSCSPRAPVAVQVERRLA